MTMSHSCKLLFASLVTAGFGAALTLAFNKKVGVLVMGAGAVGSVLNLIYVLCCRTALRDTDKNRVSDYGALDGDRFVIGQYLRSQQGKEHQF